MLITKDFSLSLSVCLCLYSIIHEKKNVVRITLHKHATMKNSLNTKTPSLVELSDEGYLFDLESHKQQNGI